MRIGVLRSGGLRMTLGTGRFELDRELCVEAAG
jgi:hypothetical protein